MALKRRARPALAATLVSALLAAAGCAVLPHPPPAREASQALPPPSRGALVSSVQRNRPASAPSDASGVRLVEAGEDALAVLLALGSRAGSALDLKYYILHDDASSRAVLRNVIDAAARGVRVRLLLDDLNSADADAVLRCLARQPGIEVRVFNPLPSARWSTLTRIVASLDDVPRISHRMHGKFVVADGIVAVTGGRNIANPYFVRSSESNFLDLDVLLAGPAAGVLSTSFDEFWNHPLAWPIGAFEGTQRPCVNGLPRRQPRPTPAGLHLAATQLADAPADATAPVAGARPVTDPGGGSSVAAGQDDADGDGPELDPPPVPALRLRDVRWVPVDVVAESPASTEAIAPALAADAPAQAAVGSREGRAVLEVMADLMRGAKQRITLVTPYLVPGPLGMDLIHELRQRGVRVRVVTNSLAATDAPIAHVGYARYRRELIGAGVELYELRNQLGRHRLRLGRLATALASLHAKAVVVDGTVAVVGSMNFDPRSRWLNSEIGIVIPEATLSARLEDILQEVAADESYRLLLDRKGRLRWLDPRTGQFAGGYEPGAGGGTRLLLKAVGPLIPDSLL